MAKVGRHGHHVCKVDALTKHIPCNWCFWWCNSQALEGEIETETEVVVVVVVVIVVSAAVVVVVVVLIIIIILYSV